MAREDTELQRRLRAELAARELKPRAASLAAGVPPNAVGKILRGETKRPEPETLEPLARYFGWPINAVLEWAGWPVQARTRTGAGDPFGALSEVLEQLRLGPQERQAVHVLVDAFRRSHLSYTTVSAMYEAAVEQAIQDAQMMAAAGGETDPESYARLVFRKARERVAEKVAQLGE